MQMCGEKKFLYYRSLIFPPPFGLNWQTRNVKWLDAQDNKNDKKDNKDAPSSLQVWGNVRSCQFLFDSSW